MKCHPTLFWLPLTCPLCTQTFQLEMELMPVEKLLIIDLLNLFQLKKICDLMRMILTMNNFIFNNERFLQQHGTAMSTRMAPAYTNIIMGEFETSANNGYADKPFLWFRYKVDIFMVWTHGEDKLNAFIFYLNSIHPTVKFTSEHSTTVVPFLDVNIQLDNNKIKTDLFCKHTDKHQYFLHSSSHPFHTRKSIPYSLALCLLWICSTETSFDLRWKELLSYLTKRGYKEMIVKDQVRRAKQIPRNKASTECPHKTKSTDGLFWVCLKCLIPCQSIVYIVIVYHIPVND